MHKNELCPMRLNGAVAGMAGTQPNYRE